VSLSGCASGSGNVYFHDDKLASSWTETDKTFSGAGYTKVYDDQLIRLAEARSRENLVLARLMAARRDRDVQDIVDEPDETASVWRLQGLLDRDWQSLVGKDRRLRDIPRPELIQLARLDQNVAAARGDIDRAQNFADDDRREIRAAAREARAKATLAQAKAKRTKTATPADAAPAQVDLSCKAVRVSPPAGAAGARLVENCNDLAGTEQVLADYLARIGPIKAGSDLSETMIAFEKADRATRTDVAGELSKALADQIEAAKTVSDEGAVAQLSEFRTNLDGFLRSVGSPGLKLASLDHLAGEVDLALIANVCADPDAFDKAVADAAKCDTVEETSTTGKAGAIWSALGALAELADATDPRFRSVAWLAGAKAIVEAAKADAKLDADQARGQAAANSAAVDAAIRQASALASAQLVLSGFDNCKGGRFACALVYFGESRNTGGIPKALLRARPLQIELEYGVRRERLFAEQQGQLIKAASAQIKAYLDGGVDPKLIAQLLFDAGLIGVAVAK